MVLVKEKLLFLSLMVFSWYLQAGESAESSIGYSSVSEALTALKAIPDAEVRYNRGWTVINLERSGDRILWSFTPDSHPAHPSAVKRAVVHNDEGISLNMSVLCKSSKEACDRLVSEFEQLNENIRKSMQQN